MFTGLTQTVGIIKNISKSSDKYDIWIESPEAASGLQIGDSVAVDGVCQTVVKKVNQNFLSRQLRKH